MKFLCVTCLTVFISGCIFSGSDIEETKIIEPYYVTYSGLNHQLIFKEKGANTSKVIISSNIDSIGYYDKYIFGKIGVQYFILNRESQILKDKYNTYFSFIEGMDKLNLKPDMQSTN